MRRRHVVRGKQSPPVPEPGLGVIEAGDCLDVISGFLGKEIRNIRMYGGHVKAEGISTTMWDRGGTVVGGNCVMLLVFAVRIMG